MTKLPILSGEEMIRRLARFGYKIVRQRGSHVRLKDPSGRRRPVTIPNHRELGPGITAAILRQANVTIEQLLAE